MHFMQSCFLILKRYSAKAKGVLNAHKLFLIFSGWRCLSVLWSVNFWGLHFKGDYFWEFISAILSLIFSLFYGLTCNILKFFWIKYEIFTSNPYSICTIFFVLHAKHLKTLCEICVDFYCLARDFLAWFPHFC